MEASTRSAKLFHIMGINMTTTSATNGARAIHRAMEVARTVAQIQRSGATLNRVARATGLSTSTAFRILRSLTDERLLRFEATDRSYHVGPLAFELGLAAQFEGGLQARWRENVDEIARETRLTTYLMARSGNEAVCLLCAQGSTALRAMPMEVGQRLPLGIGAGSLAMLATLDDGEIAAVVESQGGRRDLFPGGKIKPGEILNRVVLARQAGFAQSNGTVALGVTGIGVAIPKTEGMNQLAISVSAVANSINPTEARKLAAIIARHIGSVAFKT